MGNSGESCAAIARPAIDIIVMRVTTRCTTSEEFVAAFRELCTDHTCFIPTRAMREVGVETGFSIRLADGTPMLRGLCTVLEAWPDEQSPCGRPGLRIGIRKLTPASVPVFERLLAARAAPEVAQPPLDTVRVEAPPTIEMPPLVIVEAAQAETRTPGSSVIVPANPLGELPEAQIHAFVDEVAFEVVGAEADGAPQGELDATATVPIAVPPRDMATLLGVAPATRPRRLTGVEGAAPGATGPAGSVVGGALAGDPEPRDVVRAAPAIARALAAGAADADDEDDGRTTALERPAIVIRPGDAVPAHYVDDGMGRATPLPHRAPAGPGRAGGGIADLVGAAPALPGLPGGVALRRPGTLARLRQAIAATVRRWLAPRPRPPRPRLARTGLRALTAPERRD